MATTNDFTTNANGELRQWLPPFKLVDNSGNTQFSVSGTGTVGVSGLLDLSAIAAGNANIKATLTNATPAVTWSSSSGTAINSTAPAGYIQVLVGATTYYIPVWA